MDDDEFDEPREMLKQPPAEASPTPWDKMAEAPGGAPKSETGAEVLMFAAERSKRAGPNVRRSRFFTAAALEGRRVPPRHWLVPDLIPGRTVTLLTGDGGTGKSLIALQLAAACALGGPWLGRKVAPGPALFISAEDDEDELHRRLGDVVAAEGAGFADLDQLALRSLAGEDALLTTLDARTGQQRATDLFREIDAYMADLAPALLVLDTLADLFPGNENDRAQARHFIGLLRGLAIRHDCAVVLLAHPSLSGLASGSGTGGSTAWSNSVRSRLYFSRIVQDGYEADTAKRVLTTKKANYGEIGGELVVTWQGGVFVPEAAETSLDRMADAAAAERVFLKLLRQFNNQGRRVNHASGPNYAPKVFADHPDSEGLARAAFMGAMNTLLASGRVNIVQTGPQSRRVSHLEMSSE